MKHYRMLIFCVIFICVLGGCATNPIVNVNGMPAPSNINIGGQGTPFQYFVAVTRHFDVREGSEKRRTFEYISYEEPIKIKEGTDAIVVTMRILNPNKVPYSLWDVVEQKYEGEEYPYTTAHQTYKGSLSIQEIARTLPLDKEKSGSFKTEIRDASGNVVITMGPVAYIRVEGGGVAKDK